MGHVAAWCAAALLAGGVGAAMLPARGGGWQEIAWPFPRDAWPAGRAFRCADQSCGGAMEVYLRPKLGFCANCATGVTEDAEVDGVADLDMISDDFVPAATGMQVVVGGLAGRVRNYVVRLPTGAPRPATGMALSRPRQCDLFVVAGQGAGAGTPAAQRAVEALLQSETVAGWVRVKLGG